MRPELSRWTASMRRWVDTQAAGAPGGPPDRIDWTRALPFALLHAGCLGVVWTGVSPVAVAVAAAQEVLARQMTPQQGDRLIDESIATVAAKLH